MFSSSLVGRSVSLEEGRENGFFLSLSFFFQAHILSLCLYQGLPRDASGPQIKNLTLLLPNHSFPNAFLCDLRPNTLQAELIGQMTLTS